MRVIAGLAGGLRLRVPRDLPIRPTADRVKGALFSMVESALLRGRPEADVGTAELWDGLLVADLYAGSGALGIEALSRGAAGATFVEAEKGALRALRANLESTGVAARAEVVHGDVARSLGQLADKTAVVLLDPPYADPAIVATLDLVVASDRLAADVLLALEHGRRLMLPDKLGPLELQRRRGHGDSTLTLYARGRYARRAEVD